MPVGNGAVHVQELGQFEIGQDWRRVCPQQDVLWRQLTTDNSLSMERGQSVGDSTQNTGHELWIERPFCQGMF